jgi:hypothetical protein
MPDMVAVKEPAGERKWEKRDTCCAHPELGSGCASSERLGITSVEVNRKATASKAFTARAVPYMRRIERETVGDSAIVSRVDDRLGIE